MEVRATKAGFYGSYRNEGDVFEVADGEKASWFVPTATKQKAKAKSATESQKDEVADGEKQD